MDQRQAKRQRGSSSPGRDGTHSPGRKYGPGHGADGSMESHIFTTGGGITVIRTVETELDGHEQLEIMTDVLDDRRGAIFKSSYEYPGRYNRWSMGFVNPPIELSCNARTFKFCALNSRGAILLPAIKTALEACDAVATLTDHPTKANIMLGELAPRAAGHIEEEQRSRQASIFSVLRAVNALFASKEDEHLGLYGAFGYDLAYQFESVPLSRDRPEGHRDLVLWIPDEIVNVDEHSGQATRIKYDFAVGANHTRSIGERGDNPEAPFIKVLREEGESGEPVSDHAKGEYADLVRKAKKEFVCGNLFECVPSQTFSKPCPAPPSEIFRRVQASNPAPFSFLINLGEEEFLVGASPEMFVRCDGARVETCPISGTIRRGADAMGDADCIRELLNSGKDESELTMCTDVDRNDKSRICKPGSVQVIGRRQIEMYSRLIHTVDHVEGYLREGFDCMDAFLAHTWAVTVTGAPKAWAMRFVEENEKSPRCWYGGAIGMIRFNGTLNTGLTLRTIRIKHGEAQVRAGATLLYDSVPDDEEAETRLKASAFLDALGKPREAAAKKTSFARSPMLSRSLASSKVRVMLVDHEDSFVHTLANYMRQAGAEVTTMRPRPEALTEAAIRAQRPQLLFLSPGPGNPKDFNLTSTISLALKLGLPIFGVCLGLQGIVEHFGGKLGVLGTPVHGKPSEITRTTTEEGAPNDRLNVFQGVPMSFTAGRYHSLHGLREGMPDCLNVTAHTADGIVMALEHKELAIAAVQFHPESIMTPLDVSLRMMTNVLSLALPHPI